MKKLKLLTICAAVGVIMAVTGTAQAALDVNAIVMTSCKDHLDGTADPNPWCFEVWVELDDSGSLDNINMTLPDGLTTYPLCEEYGWWYYDSTDYPSLGVLQIDYPVGEYTFDFRDGDSSLLTFKLDYSGLTEPTNPVNFTYPAHGATDVNLNPTFTWTIDAGDGNALAMWLDNDDWYENVPVSMDTTSWGPLGPLDTNHTYDLEVSVINVKDLQPGPAFPTMTVGSDEFEYGLWIEYLNEIEFTTVPEPTTIVLLGLGSLVLLRRKTRT